MDEEEHIGDDGEINKKFTEWKNRLFSNEKLTKGEIMTILVTIVLIIVIVALSFSTKCSLDCSMCETTSQVLTQKGIL